MPIWKLSRTLTFWMSWTNYSGNLRDGQPNFTLQNADPGSGGAKIYLKREDLLHTGAHKINNALGQALLAKRMGKKRIIAETGADNTGLPRLRFVQSLDWNAKSTWAGYILNVLHAVKRCWSSWGRSIAKPLRRPSMKLWDWVTNVGPPTTFSGPPWAHPYPGMVRDFHRVISEKRKDTLKLRALAWRNDCLRGWR